MASIISKFDECFPGLSVPSFPRIILLIGLGGHQILLGLFSSTGLSQKIQTRILNSLIGRELIETKKIGIPGRRSIRVDDGKLISLIIEGKSS